MYKGRAIGPAESTIGARTRKGSGQTGRLTCQEPLEGRKGNLAGIAQIGGGLNLRALELPADLYGMGPADQGQGVIQIKDVADPPVGPVRVDADGGEAADRKLPQGLSGDQGKFGRQVRDLPGKWDSSGKDRLHLFRPEWRGFAQAKPGVE